MILLFITILIISLFDLRTIIKNKQKSDMICFAVIAIASILLGYYYTTHIYTASLVDFILTLVRVQ